jgi:hypothetical protein
MSRLTVCAVLFTASCILVTQRAEPLLAQEKKVTVASLEKQITALKQDLQTAAQLNNTLTQQNTALKADVVAHDKQIASQKQSNATLQQEVSALKTANTRLNSIIKKENIVLPAADQTILNLQTTIDGYRAAGLVHVVVMKLKSDSSSGESQALIDDAYAQLPKIKSVRGLWAGVPTSKGTSGAKSDYTVAVVLVFDNAAGLKSFLNDPIHTKYVDNHAKKWEPALIYDFEPKKPTAP